MGRPRRRRRIGTRARTIGEDFAIERPLLGRLPDDDFETGIWLTPRVDLYSQVTVRTNCYSVPVRAGRPIGPRPTARLPPGRL